MFHAQDLGHGDAREHRLGDHTGRAVAGFGVAEGLDAPVVADIDLGDIGEVDLAELGEDELGGAVGVGVGLLDIDHRLIGGEPLAECKGDQSPARTHEHGLELEGVHVLEQAEGEALIAFAEHIGADEAFVGLALVSLVGGGPPAFEQGAAVVEVGGCDRGDSDLGVLTLEAVAHLAFALEVAAGELDHGLAGVDVVAWHGGGRELHRHRVLDLDEDLVGHILDA